MQTLTRTWLSNNNVMREQILLKVTTSVILSVAAMAFISIGGCSGSNDWKTIIVKKGSRACRVIVYSPPYGKNARQPDAVIVLWDGEQVFNGILPVRTSGADFMPVELLNILCSPGNHVLEVRSETGAMKQSVDIKGNETLYYRVFGYKDGKEVLVKDMGSNPRLL